MLPSEIGERAIAILEHDGWCKKVLTDSKGRHCLAGAVQLAARGHVGKGFPDPAERELRDVLYEISGGRTLVEYNDHQALDKRYVIRKLWRAVVILKKKGR